MGKPQQNFPLNLTRDQFTTLSELTILRIDGESLLAAGLCLLN
jgi:hypothetical protein